MKKSILIAAIACTLMACKKDKQETGLTYPYTQLVGTTWYAYDYTLVGYKTYSYIQFNSATSATVYDALIDNVKRLNSVDCTLSIDAKPNHIDSFEIINKDKKIDLVGFTTEDVTKINVDNTTYSKY